jgi:hypothetical protein
MGVFTKFWFDLKLPDSWLSQCFEQSYISMLRTSIIFNFRQIDYSKNPFEYAEFEKKCMLYLENMINELNVCCQPNLRSESLCDGCISRLDVDEFFKNNGFDSLSILVLNPDSSIIENCLCQTGGISVLSKEDNQLERSELLNDYTHGYIISIDGTEFNLSEKGLRIFEIYDNPYLAITHSLNYCQEDFYSMMAAFNKSNVAFWFHVSGDKLYFKGKGVSGEIIIGSCSKQQYYDQMVCILDKFESSGVNLYSEIMNKFDESRKDFVINVGLPPGDSTSHGQTIDKLLGSLGIVEIYLNPDQFDNIENYPLRPAATLIHEMCHGLLSLYVLRAKGPDKCTILDYSYYYIYYQNIGETDECIIARHFIDKQAELLWFYNGKWMGKKHYLSSAWGPYFADYKDCNSNVNYTQEQISNWYLEMRDSCLHPVPCTLN